MTAEQATETHTPEPWEVRDGMVIKAVGDDGAYVAAAVRAPAGHSKEQADANARRIVACVNACAGIPTEDLEGDYVAFLCEVERSHAANCAQAEAQP
jgi:hypothetical protein